MNRSPLRKLLSVFLIALTLLIFPFKKVYADTMLFVSPTRVHLSDENKVATVNVTNNSQSKKHYKISFANIVMTPKGVTTEAENFEYSAKRLLRFFPREVTLEPGERQTIRIMSRITSDLPDGDYHVHLHFLDEPIKQDYDEDGGKKAVMRAPLTYSTMIPLILSHGSVKSSVDATGVKINKSEDGKKYVVSMMLQRAGNGQGTAYVKTLFISNDGSEIVPTPKRTAYIYRELGEREYKYEFPVADAKSGKLKINIFDSPSKNAQPIREFILPLP